MANDQSLRSGLNLVLISLLFLCCGILVGVAELVSTWKGHGMSLGISQICLYAFPVLSLVGKLMCCRTPVHRDLIQGALFLEVLGIALAAINVGGFSSLCVLAGSGVFLMFLYQLSKFTEEPRAGKTVVRTAKCAGYSLLGFPIAIFFAFAYGPLMLLGVLWFVGFFLASFLNYGNSLVLLRNALAARSGPTHGF